VPPVRMRALTGRCPQDVLIHGIAAYTRFNHGGFAYWLPCTGQYLGVCAPGPYIVEDGRVVTCLVCWAWRGGPR